MVDLSTVPARKLLATIEKRAARVSVNTTALINAGYGSMRGSDIRERANDLACGEPLFREYVDAMDSVQEAYAEQAARRRYHGTDRPIKRRAY